MTLEFADQIEEASFRSAEMAAVTNKKYLHPEWPTSLTRVLLRCASSPWSGAFSPRGALSTKPCGRSRPTWQNAGCRPSRNLSNVQRSERVDWGNACWLDARHGFVGRLRAGGR